LNITAKIVECAMSAAGPFKTSWRDGAISEFTRKAKVIRSL
jgi:hypothetical protein